MDENRKLHLLLKQIFEVLGSKKEDHTRLGMGDGKESSEVQGWIGVLLFRSQWDMGRESADGVKQRIEGGPTSDLKATLAFTPGP